MTTDAFLKRTILLSFHALLFFTPLIWTAKTSELFELPKMLFVYAMTVIIVTAWLGRMVVQGRLILAKTFFDLPIILFLASQTISTIVSIDPHTSLFGYYSRFNGGLLSTLSYILLYYALVSNFSSSSNKYRKIGGGNTFFGFLLATKNGRNEVNKFSTKNKLHASGEGDNFFGISLTWPTAKHGVGSYKKPQHSSIEISKKFITESLANSQLVLSLLTTTLIGATLAALYAFIEHFGYSPSCKIIGGGWAADCWVQDVVTRVFGTFGQPNWLAAYLISLIFLPLAALLTKNGGDNNTALFGGGGVKFSLSALTRVQLEHHISKSTHSQSKSFADKKISDNATQPMALIISFSLFTLFFSTLLFTKSRSGIAGFAIGLLIYVVGLFYLTRFQKKTFITVLAVFGLLATLYGFLGKGTISTLDAYLFTKPNPTTTTTQAPPAVQVGTVLDTGGTESGDIRKIVWQGAVDIVKANPLFGTGVETFAYSYYNFRPAPHNLTSEWDFLYNKAHNEWLNHAANSGLFGLLSYLLLMLSFIIYSFRKVVARKEFFEVSSTWPTAKSESSKSASYQAKSQQETEKNSFSEKQQLIILALLSGYLALAISNFFGFSTVAVSLLFFLFPAFAYLLTKPPTSDRTDTSSSTLSTTQNALLFAVVLIGFFGIFQVYRLYSADLAYAQGKAHSDAGQIQASLSQLEQAIKLLPSEASYKDEFAQATTNAAIYLYEQNQATAAAQIAKLAIAASDQAIDQNSVHLNFYKTRARLLANLSIFEPSYLTAASDTLLQSLRLAPTDAKLFFSLGMTYYQAGELDKAITQINKSIELKPNYELARYTLGEIYQLKGENDRALEQFRYIVDTIAPNNQKARQKITELTTN